MTQHQKPSLFDVIQKIRMLAASCYDNAEGAEIPIEKIQEHVQPLQKMLKESISASPVHELAKAVKEFEALEESHISMAKMYKAKARDCRGHLDSLGEELKKRMKDQRVDFLSSGDFVITLSEADGVERLSIR